MFHAAMVKESIRKRCDLKMNYNIMDIDDLVVKLTNLQDPFMGGIITVWSDLNLTSNDPLECICIRGLYHNIIQHLDERDDLFQSSGKKLCDIVRMIQKCHIDHPTNLIKVLHLIYNIYKQYYNEVDNDITSESTNYTDMFSVLYFYDCIDDNDLLRYLDQSFQEIVTTGQSCIRKFGHGGSPLQPKRSGTQLKFISVTPEGCSDLKKIISFGLKLLKSDGRVLVPPDFEQLLLTKSSFSLDDCFDENLIQNLINYQILQSTKFIISQIRSDDTELKLSYFTYLLEQLTMFHNKYTENLCISLAYLMTIIICQEYAIVTKEYINKSVPKLINQLTNEIKSMYNGRIEHDMSLLEFLETPYVVDDKLDRPAIYEISKMFQPALWNNSIPVTKSFEAKCQKIQLETTLLVQST